MEFVLTGGLDLGQGMKFSLYKVERRRSLEVGIPIEGESSVLMRKIMCVTMFTTVTAGAVKKLRGCSVSIPARS